MIHPHSDKRHVMVSMRRYILGVKKKFGTARGLMHYAGIISTYKLAKVSLL